MNKKQVVSRMLCHFSVIGLILSWIPILSNAAQPSPREVEVGIYVNNVPAVNLKDKKFQVDFNIWFRWKGDDINPVETFKIFNGHVDLKDAVEKKKIDDVNYASAHVEATIYRNFDVDRYPLDNQTLKIQIEDSKTNGDLINFAADKVNSNINSKLTVPGYILGKIESYSSVTSYNTNYGDTSLGRDAVAKYPRFTFSIELTRPGYKYFFKYFSVLFLAAALTFLAFWISVEMIDTRYWLVTSAYFLAAITGGTLASTLPETESFGLGDILYNLTMIFILISTAVMIHNHKVFSADDARAHRLTQLWGLGLPIVYVVSAVIVVIAT